MLRQRCRNPFASQRIRNEGSVYIQGLFAQVHIGKIGAVTVHGSFELVPRPIMVDGQFVAHLASLAGPPSASGMTTWLDTCRPSRQHATAWRYSPTILSLSALSTSRSFDKAKGIARTFHPAQSPLFGTVAERHLTSKRLKLFQANQAVENTQAFTLAQFT